MHSEWPRLFLRKCLLGPFIDPRGSGSAYLQPFLVLDVFDSLRDIHDFRVSDDHHLLAQGGNCLLTLAMNVALLQASSFLFV